jgi:hypothetical protein
MKHTIPPAKFGWTWIDGEDDNKGTDWIQIGAVQEDGTLGDGICVLILRHAKHNAHVRPELERKAKIITEALTEYFGKHGLCEGFLYAG